MNAEEYLAQPEKKKPAPAPGSAAEALAKGAEKTVAEESSPDRDPKKVTGKI